MRSATTSVRLTLSCLHWLSFGRSGVRRAFDAREYPTLLQCQLVSPPTDFAAPPEWLYGHIFRCFCLLRSLLRSKLRNKLYWVKYGQPIFSGLPHPTHHLFDTIFFDILSVQLLFLNTLIKRAHRCTSLGGWSFAAFLVPGHDVWVWLQV